MVIMSDQTRFVGILSLFDEEGDETLEEISSELRKMFMTKQRLKQLSMPSLQDLYLDLPAMKFRIKSFILWRSLSFVVTLSWFLSCYCSSYFLVSSIWMEVMCPTGNSKPWTMKYGQKISLNLRCSENKASMAACNYTWYDVAPAFIWSWSYWLDYTHHQLHEYRGHADTVPGTDTLEHSLTAGGGGSVLLLDGTKLLQGLHLGLSKIWFHVYIPEKRSFISTG